MLGNTTMTDEGILKVMGEEAVGVYSAGWYAAGLDTPDNKKFVAGINAAYKHDPGFYTAGPYTALLIIEEALKTTGGKTDDAAAFLKAMHDVRLTHGPIGPVKLDEYGTPVLDIHIRKVARVNGKLTNTIIKTYPQVSQFWTNDPKKSSSSRSSRAISRRANISNRGASIMLTRRSILLGGLGLSLGRAAALPRAQSRPHGLQGQSGSWFRSRPAVQST